MDDNPPTEKLDDLIGYNLRRASAAMLSDFAAMFADTFLRPTSFSVACVIAEQPGITSAEICRILGLQRANIVTLLAELDAADVVRRVDDESDRRIQRLYLNADRQEDLRHWRQMADRHEARMLGGLSQEEQAALLTMLGKIWREDR